MTLARRQLLKSLVAASLFPAIRLDRSSPPRSRPLLGLGGDPDWLAIRALFPLAPDWTHLSSFLFVSHPKPVADEEAREVRPIRRERDRKSTRLNSSHANISYAVFCLKKKTQC